VDSGCQRRCIASFVVLAALLPGPRGAAYADSTVTLAQRAFAATSPAAPFQTFFGDARRRAAATTPAWSAIDADLSAWGPALIFPLLDRSVATETVLDLAAPLESEGTAPLLVYRTLGLYAAKSRVPFLPTPTLQRAVDRNLRTLERATRDLDTFLGGRDLAPWGSIGAGAWLAYLELLYRDYFDLGNPGATRWNADGLRIVDELLARGQLPDKGFRRDLRDEQLSLWPTALAIYALTKAYENEELVRYESAALAAAAAVESLRADDGSYYTTPARSERDPRANAYLAGALLLIFKDTGDVQYRDRAVTILRWLTTGPGATASVAEANIGAHVAYLALLLDSLSTQPYDTLLGRRPMQVTSELGGATTQAVDAMAKRLRPADFRYRALFDGVLHTLVEHVPQLAGDFAHDYGDAAGYAADVLLAGGDTTVSAPVIQRQARLLAWPRPRNFDEMSFGVEALFAGLDHPEVADVAVADGALRRYVVLTAGIAFADRYYLDWLDWFTGGGGFEYGPTVLGAQIAATQLRYAGRFPGQKVAGVVAPFAVGRGLLDGAEQAAWDPSRHVYRARAGSDIVALLPNAMMVLDLLQAHEIGGDATSLARAEEVATGLETLWDDQRGAYFASSEQTGAEGYQSLSTNSYAALAQLRLFKATQKAAYRERAVRIVDFISRDLYAGGIIYHHVYRGRRAAGDVWCTGCNWRVLRILMELEGLA